MGIFDRGYVETSRFYESIDMLTTLGLIGMVAWAWTRTYKNRIDIIDMQYHRHTYQGDQKTSFPVTSESDYLSGGWY